MDTKKTKSGLNTLDFEGVVDEKPVKIYILTNKQGSEATITNYGAKIVSLCVPNSGGTLTDVVLGHDSLRDYLHSEEPYLGAICGRTGNRIAKGKFTLDGESYQLAINNGDNDLHGGIKGFNAVVWDAEQIDNQSLKLTYTSRDGEEGYPGNLSVEVVYTFTDSNALEIRYQASTDKATIINLTNHSYFNLSGAGSPSVLKHIVKIKASRYLPVDKSLIPLGTPQSVINTPFDFITEHEIGERINQKNEQLEIANGYDHTFVLDKGDKVYDIIAECTSPKSGIKMQIKTTEPGVQLYSNNWMDKNFKGKHNKYYPARSAICFETQHYPDSINHPDYPSIILRPGEIYNSKTSYIFSAE